MLFSGKLAFRAGIAQGLGALNSKYGRVVERRVLHCVVIRPVLALFSGIPLSHTLLITLKIGNPSNTAMPLPMNPLVPATLLEEQKPVTGLKCPPLQGNSQERNRWDSRTETAHQDRWQAQIEGLG